MAIEKYFQTIDGSQIFYQIFGKETNYPLVLLHGNGNDHTFLIIKFLISPRSIKLLRWIPADMDVPPIHKVN